MRWREYRELYRSCYCTCEMIFILPISYPHLHAQIEYCSYN